MVFVIQYVVSVLVSIQSVETLVSEDPSMLLVYSLLSDFSCVLQVYLQINLLSCAFISLNVSLHILLPLVQARRGFSVSSSVLIHATICPIASKIYIRKGVLYIS